MQYFRMIVLPMLGKTTVKSTSGEVRTYTDYASLEKDYVAGDLHPGDVKPALARDINVRMFSHVFVRVAHTTAPPVTVLT